MSRRIVIVVLIKNEIVAIFIDSIIGKVHEEVIQVGIGRADIFLSGETCQAFLVNKNSEGIYTIEEDIDAEVKFEIVNEVGFSKVALGDHLITLFDIYFFKFSS